MSTNCIRCVVSKRTGLDLLCDDCRKIEAHSVPDQGPEVGVSSGEPDASADNVNAVLQKARCPYQYCGSKRIRLLFHCTSCDKMWVVPGGGLNRPPSPQETEAASKAGEDVPTRKEILDALVDIHLFFIRRGKVISASAISWAIKAIQNPSGNATETKTLEEKEP